MAWLFPSLRGYRRGASRPHIAALGRQRGRGPFVDLRRHPGYAPPDGIAVLRIEGGLFFAGDVGRVRDVLRRSGDEAVPAYPDVESAIAAFERGEHR